MNLVAVDYWIAVLTCWHEGYESFDLVPMLYHEVFQIKQLHLFLFLTWVPAGGRLLVILGACELDQIKAGVEVCI